MSTYGLMAEFETPEQLIEAARRARDAGYTKVDAYSPMPVEGLDAALGIRPSRLPFLVLGAGLTGTASALALQYWVQVIDYPLNVGGKPLFSWPAFMVVMFELTVLFAAFGGVILMLARNGLPQPYHPVFNVTSFERASQDRFFLCIEADDPNYEEEKTRDFLGALQAQEVSVVPA
jgi:hypothetical protein